MATYTQFDTNHPGADSWSNVMGMAYQASATTITLFNNDGSLTKAHGSFIIFQGALVGGVISSLDLVSPDSATTYSTITGFSLDATAFIAAPSHDKLALALVGQDIVIGSSNNDYQIGGAQDDQLYGGDGNDRLDGGTGADLMVGGNGTDTYYVDNIGDVIKEARDGGNDYVYVSLPGNYTLPATVENLIFASPGPHIGIGNNSDNYLSGYNGNDTLKGGGGNDTLVGHIGDTLIGGTGDDNYTIWGTGTKIVEFAGEGNDSVWVQLSDYTLPANVENLYVSDLYDPGLWTGIGNDLDNVIEGSTFSYDAEFSLFGMGGNDHLRANGRSNTFDGGDGDDTARVGGTLDIYTAQDLGSRIELKYWSVIGYKLTNIEHIQFDDGTVDVADGNPLFDTLYYMHENLDVFHAGANALAHYNSVGWQEGRDPNAFFDTTAYLAAHKDVAASGLNPLDHYDQIGWKLGYDPSPNFDTKLYLLHNPDVAAAGIDPLTHYLQNGRAEGRPIYQAIGETIVNGFDAEYYLMHNQDVAAAGVDPLAHFMSSGWKEGRNPNAWFDTAGYLAHYGDIAAAGINPLDHYMTAGWLEGRDPSATFDTLGYLAANPDIAAAGINPLQHFLQFGIYEGRMAVNDGVWH